MEDLSKTQIVLLCLLVSFVTSIGTGVITSSLLQEAPQTVTQTINRVVERTVETIVPQSQPGVVTRETTVVVKEEDLVIDAIKKTHGNLVWIVSPDSGSNAPVRTVGVVVNKDGTILADKRFVSARGNYNAVFFESGQVYTVKLSEVSRRTNAAFLKPEIKEGQPSTFTPANFGNSNNVQLGQTVIALGGKDKESVSIGRVISLNRGNVPANASSTPAVQSLVTDTPLHDFVPGSVLLTLNGDIVGFENYIVEQGLENTYSALNLIREDNPVAFGEAATQ